MVEWFNHTLKAILRKHAATYGNQWDHYLFGGLYAYCNTPHESTGEKPSYLLFGLDCQTPTEATFFNITPANIQCYWLSRRANAGIIICKTHCSSLNTTGPTMLQETLWLECKILTSLCWRLGFGPQTNMGNIVNYLALGMGPSVLL